MIISYVYINAPEGCQTRHTHNGTAYTLTGGTYFFLFILLERGTLRLYTNTQTHTADTNRVLIYRFTVHTTNTQRAARGPTKYGAGSHYILRNFQCGACASYTSARPSSARAHIPQPTAARRRRSSYPPFLHGSLHFAAYETAADHPCC